MAASEYATIRDHLKELVGHKLIEITQHDAEYFREHGVGFVDLMFEGGNVLRLWSLHGDEPFLVINPEGETPEDIVRQ